MALYELINVFCSHHHPNSFHTSSKHNDNEEEFQFHYRSSKGSLALAMWNIQQLQINLIDNELLITVTWGV